MEKEFLYVRIARTIERQILDGVLKVGDKLPSIRTICQENGVSMNTATQVYHELEKKMLIESRPQSGFYVSRMPVRRMPVPVRDSRKIGIGEEEPEDLITRVYGTMGDTGLTRLSLGVPDNSLLPIARLNKGMVEAMRSLPGSGTGYENLAGNRKLRRDIAHWSFTWGGNLTEEDIVTTAGAINAISFCLMALTKPGDTLAVESPVYFGILQLARSLGLRVLELPTCPIIGVYPDTLEKVIHKIDVCLLVSNFNNPIGSCMPDENKKAVVALLEKHGVPLIEDDLYGDVYFGKSRPRSCKTFDESGNVLWCGSVSKTLAPGYRVGWVAPGKYREKILRMKMLHAISSTTITQEVIADFMENGRYENHLRNLRRTLHANSLRFTRAIADYFPEGTRVSCPEGGFVLWLELDRRIDTAELYELAMRQKISIAPGRMFTLQDKFSNCMRLSFGQTWTPELEDKLKVLGAITKRMISG